MWQHDLSLAPFVADSGVKDVQYRRSQQTVQFEA